MNIEQWASRWNISQAALAELASVYMEAAPKNHPLKGKARNEADILALTKLKASEQGARLFRNNVGSLKDSNGRHIRFGLANESTRLNASLKSSDLIGLRPVEIDVTWLGRTIGQFVAVECKRPGWRHSGTTRENAQSNFHKMVASLGGHACFTSTGDF